MKIILLAGTASHNGTKSPALHEVSSDIWLDVIIDRLLPLRAEVEVVFGKYFSDEILRTSKKIRECDIIFDPNEDELGPFSNYRAALHSVNSAAIIYPISYYLPNSSVWIKMISRLGLSLATQIDIVRPYCPVAGEMVAGYPVGITRSGKIKLTKNKQIQDFASKDLIEYKLPVLDIQITKSNDEFRQNLPVSA